MNLHGLAQNLALDKRIENIVAIKKAEIDGLSGSSASAFYSALYLKTGKPLFIISQNASAISNDMRSFLGSDLVSFFPSWDTFPTEDISPSKEIVGERLKILERLSRGEKMVIASNIKSAVTRVMPKDILKKYSINLQQGSTKVKRDELIRGLVKIGFKRRDIVGERGEFSVKGGIVDIFGSNLNNPTRIEYIGDKIESIRSFDAINQRSVTNLDETIILPLHEIVLEDDGEYSDGIELKIPEVYSEFTGIFGYIGEAIVILENTSGLKLACDKFIKEADEIEGRPSGKHYLSFSELEEKISNYPVIEHNEGGGGISLGFGNAESFYCKLDRLCEWLEGSKHENSIFIVSKQVDRLSSLFIERGISAQKIEDIPLNIEKGVYILYGDVEEGFSGNGITILTDREIFGELPSKVKFTPKPSEGISNNLLTELEPGDYVVHTNHGIGIYRGLQKLEIGGALQEYIQIDYAEDDKLYVPLHQMAMVERYSGGGDGRPKIGRLGGADWAKVKSRAKRSIKDIAAELFDIYTSRHKEAGLRFPPDSLWQIEFEKSFPYEETPDQARAILDIKKEMEEGKLIDRLVCGDVGYGKTEVALRAAFKTILSGKQAALLTPTTILADQHYHTFSQRFKPYPVIVEMLSRFRGKEEQKQILKDLEAGAVDMIIGTHRLISKDVKFKDLGLLIIDEEQKFGVSHKEKLKKLAKNVNVITMTATPIPRTLYMALSGVRELSVIATPPLDRSPIRTYLREWSETTIKEAIRRELERGGQVYFVHNLVKSIYKIADMIKSIVPEARVAVGHGQMDEKELEEVMVKFINREYDVLISTSIIESGLDIPSVNTVIIDHAENFGLAQLYQIRGRVGRSSARAFAYLLYHKGEVLTDKALERLKAIQEFTALGSGYKLAMADLEIRGAGTLLGAEQHGHILNIGFDMYCDLLEESVMELKHLEAPAAKKMLIDLKIDAFIPKDYVPDDKQRIALYRRMNSLSSRDELGDFREEMVDRFGSVPPELGSLFKIIDLKIKAADKGISSIIGGSTSVEIWTEQKKPMIIKTKDMPQEKWFRLVSDTIEKHQNK